MGLCNVHIYNTQFIFIYSQRPKDLKVLWAQPCATAASNPIVNDRFVFRKMERNQYYFSTIVHVAETITNDLAVSQRYSAKLSSVLFFSYILFVFFCLSLQFRMNILVCALDKRHCIDTAINAGSICNHLSDRSALYTPLLDSIEPPLRCPLQKVRYAHLNTLVRHPYMSGAKLQFIWIVFAGLLPHQKWYIRSEYHHAHTTRAAKYLREHHISGANR